MVHGQKSHGTGERGMVPFLSPNIVQIYLNYVSWQKTATRERGSMVPFFVAKYISNLFELCFMTKKSHGAVERGSIVPFFVAKYISNLFELWFMAKK